MILGTDKSFLIEHLWGLKSEIINFNTEKNKKVINSLKKKLFKENELLTSGKSSVSVLVKRTFAQYLGQKYWVKSRVIWWTKQLTGLLAMPILTLFLFMNRKKSTELSAERQVEALCFSYFDYRRPFLDEIFKHDYEIATMSLKDCSLVAEDFSFLYKIIKIYPRYLLYPDLISRMIRWVGLYSTNIRLYHPKIISNYFESSCLSSLMTAYCREKGVFHANIMHGIRFYSSQIAFAEFDYFYVWGTFHAENFKSMYVSARNFIISGNPFHKKSLQLGENKNSNVNYKKLLIMFEFHLWNDKKLFYLLCNLIKEIPDDWQIACRLHYLEIKRSKIFINQVERNTGRRILAEDPNQLTINDSIRDSGICVGCYSNALTDAWMAEKKVICLRTKEIDSIIPQMEWQTSKNVKIYYFNDNIYDFLYAPVQEDAYELRLRECFSKL